MLTFFTKRHYSNLALFSLSIPVSVSAKIIRIVRRQLILDIAGKGSCKKFDIAVPVTITGFGISGIKLIRCVQVICRNSFAINFFVFDSTHYTTHRIIAIEVVCCSFRSGNFKCFDAFPDKMVKSVSPFMCQTSCTTHSGKVDVVCINRVVSSCRSFTTSAICSVLHSDSIA